MDTGTDSTAATLVAIARDEGRYLVEWLAHHLAIGFAHIRVYDHGSVDAMPKLLAAISTADPRVSYQPWQVTAGSPQIAAYNHALPQVTTPWVAFMDVDEFLVPECDGSLPAFLARVPQDVSCVHLNWRGFGSNRRADDAYELVTRAFTRRAKDAWGNHCHFKSIARTSQVTAVHIHDVDVRAGRSVLPDFQPSEVANRGRSDRVCYDGIWINHYQSKTFAEFEKRMQRGSVNFPAELGVAPRDASLERFQVLDRNEVHDMTILQFDAAFLLEHEKLKYLLK